MSHQNRWWHSPEAPITTCAEKFKDLQFGLKLIFQNTGQQEFLIDPTTVDAPDKVLSDWVVASYAKSQLNDQSQ